MERIVERGRLFGVRPAVLTLLALLVGLSLAPYPSPPAGASCAASRLSIDGQEPTQGRVDLRRGQEVTVSGRGFVDGCDDGGEGPSTFGCSGDDGGDAEKPLQDIELVVLQGRPTPEQTSLAVADAGTAEDNHLGWVSWTFRVPTTLELGPAVLKTEGSEPIRINVVAAGPDDTPPSAEPLS